MSKGFCIRTLSRYEELRKGGVCCKLVGGEADKKMLLVQLPEEIGFQRNGD